MNARNRQEPYPMEGYSTYISDRRQDIFVHNNLP